jgi:peptide/nickel transport system permease protein
MWKLVAQRSLAMVPLLLLVAVLVFVLFSFVPVDAASVILGQSGSIEDREQLREELGLDRPLIVQFGEWLAGIFRGDFGTSYITRRPVIGDIAAGLPITLSLVVGGLVLAFVLGIVVGVVSALRAGSLRDRLLTTGGSLFQATPEFWLALLLVWIVAVQAGLLPIGGYTEFGRDPGEWLRRMILPWFAVALGPASQIARVTRSGMIDQLESQYVRALTARGTPRRRVVFGYALKNALVPVVALAGLLLALALGSSFVIESIFSLPGLGSRLIDALTAGDTPMLMASVVVVAFFVILINLLVDIVIGLLNPKVRPR